MRLAILNLTASGISGGYKSYLRNILPRLAADGRVRSVLCCSPAALRVEEWVSPHEKIRFADCAPFRPLAFGPDRGLERALSSFEPDVLFTPSARAARFRRVPVVTMVQNMAPLGPWGAYGPSEWPRLAAQRYETRRAVRQAQGIVAISEFVRRFLVKDWGIDERKIVSIYFGAVAPDPESLRPARLPPGWSDFLFTAGSVEPYRGLEDLIGGAAVSRRRGRPLRIALAGSARPSMRRYEARLLAAARRAGVSADLCWLGQLSGAEMTWCYRNCVAFVMTSRVEACPNTALEAMACGSVCVAADNAPLPELFARAALYYKPGDEEALAAAVRQVSSWDGARRAAASAAASERARTFSWDAAADATAGFLARVSRARA